jgi:hypothetical protein
VSQPDIQYFAETGTWLKPPGAVNVYVLLCAGSGGLAVGYGDSRYMIGVEGELTCRRFTASELPAEVGIAVGYGGGFALIVTHLPGDPPPPPVPLSSVRGAYGWKSGGLPPTGVDGGEV